LDQGEERATPSFFIRYPESVGMEAENLGGAAGAVNHPVGLLDNGQDVVALHGFKLLAKSNSI
jgi:hypothetical protein